MYPYCMRMCCNDSLVGLLFTCGFSGVEVVTAICNKFATFVIFDEIARTIQIGSARDLRSDIGSKQDANSRPETPRKLDLYVRAI